MTEQQKFNALERLAEGAASDIAGDYPDGIGGQPLDVGYNLYVETLGKRVMGLIDMGDMYQGVFEWVGDCWEMAGDDPYELEDKILKKRGI